jgi:hypothetical protein
MGGAKRVCGWYQIHRMGDPGLFIALAKSFRAFHCRCCCSMPKGDTEGLAVHEDVVVGARSAVWALRGLFLAPVVGWNTNHRKELGAGLGVVH